MKSIVLLYILSLSLLTYLFSPEKYSYLYIVFCGINYVIFIVLYFFAERKKNYFCFETLFFIALFLSTQYYPLFVHNQMDTSRYFMFLFDFDENYIPKASALSLLGVGGFISAMLLVRTKQISIGFQYQQLIPLDMLYICSVLSFILYFITGGYAQLASQYSGGDVIESSGISAYFMVLSPVFMIVAIVLNFIKIKTKYNNFKISYISRIGKITVMGILGLLLLAGSRTLTLQMLILIMALYSYLFRPISLKLTLTFILIGITLMFTVGYLRGLKEGSTKFYLSDLFMDLLITNRASFTALEYVDKFDFTYGETMLGTLLSPFPFGQNIAIRFFDLNPNRMMSSLLYTEYTLGSVTTLGLGTNIIADLYFAFGSIGVFIFMFALGFLVKKSSVKAQYSIFSLLIYAIITSYSVFLVRAEFFTFLRVMLWSIVILFIVTRTKSSWKKF
ncbi:conserved membrane hypothetical protein [Moraxellaceae bacterium 17A]|nr:conserved membrane hypothetical protein [Moraxellaceae bacterium 17A]